VGVGELPSTATLIGDAIVLISVAFRVILEQRTRETVS
jgi:hypothetical protein